MLLPAKTDISLLWNHINLQLLETLELEEKVAQLLVRGS